MRRPASLIIFLVGMFTILGMFGFGPQSAAFLTECSAFGISTPSDISQEGGAISSQVKPVSRNIDAQNLRYYEESNVRAIKKADGEQTKEPNPKRTVHVIPVTNSFTVVTNGRSCRQRLSVLDSPCLTRIDQLPLDNRPPPAIC